MSAGEAATMPRGTLALAGGLMLFSLVAVGTARLSGAPPAASPELLREAQRVEPLATRRLRFLDGADGGVVIRDMDDRRVVRAIPPGEGNGFIRGVMRGLARDRRMRGADQGAPFTLTAWADGELSLTDDATGRSIELSAFGADNRRSFASLLEGAR